MIDRIFVNARAADGSAIHLVASDGRFAAIGPDEPASQPGAEQVDLQGWVVLPGLVDGHIHLDKSFVGDRWHPHRPAATLRERLAVESASWRRHRRSRSARTH